MPKNLDANPAISIVMTYYERPDQLRTTLDSFRYHEYGTEVEVIIVDDGSMVKKAEDVVGDYGFPIRIIYMDPKKKWYSNSCVPFNAGFKAARADKVIIQNAECFHYDNVVTHVLNNINNDRYITYACYSQTEEQYYQSKTIEGFDKLRKTFYFQDIPAIGNGVPGWYNHSIFNPRALHFCSAISRKNLEMLRGFDVSYAKGSCFDDDEFLFRIRKLIPNIVITDNVRVVHQWHYNKMFEENADVNKRYQRNYYLFSKYTSKNKSTKIGVLSFILSTEKDRIRHLLGEIGLVKKLYKYLFKNH